MPKFPFSTIALTKKMLICLLAEHFISTSAKYSIRVYPVEEIFERKYKSRIAHHNTTKYWFGMQIAISKEVFVWIQFGVVVTTTLHNGYVFKVHKYSNLV